VYRIAYFSAGTPGPVTTVLLKALHESLRELGWIEGEELRL